RESSSSVLAVCKRWARVGTPLLYETVVLRSTPQAQALAAALKDNKPFGKMIKKLRVEGGYGAAVPKIFKLAPNITDLCLNLHLYADDKVIPMYKALFDAVKPRRLVLYHAEYSFNDNKGVRLALSTLCDCITNWESLRVIVLSDIFLDDEELPPGCDSSIFDAVCSASSLEEICIPQRVPRAGRRAMYVDIFSRLTERSTASLIRVGWPAVLTDFGFTIDLKEPLSAVAQQKLCFAPPKRAISGLEAVAQEVAASTVHPNFIPMASAPDSVREQIWGHIIRHVISHSQGVKDGDSDSDWDSSSSSDSDSDSDSDSNSILTSDDEQRQSRLRGPVLQCMSVCKLWLRITRQLACRSISVLNRKQFDSLADFASKYPALFRLCRHMKLFDDFSWVALRTDGLRDALVTLISHAHDLVSFRLNSFPLPPDVLRILGEHSASSLVRLYITDTTSEQYTLPSFVNLRSLHIDCAEGTSWRFDGSPPAFPLLEEVIVSSGNELLSTLALCSLPSITCLDYDCDEDESVFPPGIRTFTAAHGDKLRLFRGANMSQWARFILESCPSLTTLDLHCWTHPPTAKELCPASPHTSLEEIVAPSRNIGNSKQFASTWSPFLDALRPETFPVLQTLKINSWEDEGLWPVTPRDIAKSPLPAAAEILLKRGIRMVDAAGRGWKPRLKLRKGDSTR
ncbi:hypothetical protein EXIGLDRAFT_764548, partial [Exidia glandulosa HHB12029]